MAGVVEAQNRQGRPAFPTQPRVPRSIARLREPVDREKVQSLLFAQNFFNIEGLGKCLTFSTFSKDFFAMYKLYNISLSEKWLKQTKKKDWNLILLIVEADFVIRFQNTNIFTLKNIRFISKFILV